MTDYETAEAMAVNSDQLINVLRTASDEQMQVICGHIINCFKALTDDEMSRDETKLRLLIEVNHLHSEFVENVFIPRLSALRSAA